MDEDFKYALYALISVLVTIVGFLFGQWKRKIDKKAEENEAYAIDNRIEIEKEKITSELKLANNRKEINSMAGEAKKMSLENKEQYNRLLNSQIKTNEIVAALAVTVGQNSNDINYLKEGMKFYVRK